MDSTTTHTTETTTVGKPRNPALTAITILIFIVLIFIGIALAIYSARYVSDAVSKLSHNTTNTNLSVVSTTTIPFSTSTTTTVTTSAGYGLTMPQATNITTTSTPPPATTTTRPSSTGTTKTTHTLYGLPDLKTTIIAVGYLANGSNDSFVAAQVIPIGARAAVRFSISNAGTNATGPWNFGARIPTQNGYTYNGPIESSMNPGDGVVFTLGFDQVPPGTNEPITIVADPNNLIQETNEADNGATAVVSVVAS